jgi:hypothetical protein
MGSDQHFRHAGGICRRTGNVDLTPFISPE